MSNICLIGCVKTKRSKPCAAVDMYISPLFRLRLRYAQKLGIKCYIISAKYGLLEPQTIIAPYNTTLKDMTSHERKMWAMRVIQELERREKIGRGGYWFWQEKNTANISPDSTACHIRSAA